MVHVPRSTFEMGSQRFYPEEMPVRTVKVRGFHIDATPVTNAQFADFVAATGYRTLAEHDPNPADYPELDDVLVVAGSAVFEPPVAAVSLADYHQWWRFVPGADWRNPAGPESEVVRWAEHPVVQIAYADAAAYASWAGKALPTEAEWELAARGGAGGMRVCVGRRAGPSRRDTCELLAGHVPASK